MNYILEKLEDNLNPLLFNYLRKTIRSKEFIYEVVFLLLVYISLYFIIILNISKSREYILTCYKVLAFIFLEAFVVISMELRKLAISEVDNDNIYFIFMSNITASNFIKAKFSLGIFYSFILFFSAIPIYLLIYFTGGIDAYRLIRIFYYSCIPTFPVFLFLISEGVVDGRGNKTAVYVHGLVNFIGLLFYGYLIIRVGMVEGIRDVNYNEIVGIVILDFVFLFVCLIVSVFIYLLLYSKITKAYPMSEVDFPFVPKIRKDFSHKLKKSESSKNINFDNKLVVSKAIDLDGKKGSIKTHDVTVKIDSSNVLDSKNKMDFFDVVYSEKKLESFSSNDTLPELNDYESNRNENKIEYSKKVKTSSETIIKIIITVLWCIGNVLIFLRSMFGYFFADLFFFIFPWICVYCHSRDAIYDRRNKLEIPEPGLDRILKFPFVSGYVNGIAWLAIMGFVYFFVLVLVYGLHPEPEIGRAYFVGECYEYGYSVLIGFMLNISSWCFLGRYIANKFFKKEGNENNYLSVSIILIFLASVCTAFLPKDPESFTLLNYFLPTMPSLISYHFFKKPLAFIFNLFFFIATIIPNSKTIYNQAESYFNH